VKVAHLLMLRAIAAPKKKNDRLDAGKTADCLRCDFLPECHIASTAIRTDGEPRATDTCWCARWPARDCLIPVGQSIERRYLVSCC
jgi:hypothetical protein